MSKNYLWKLTGVIGHPVDGNPTGVMQEAAFADKGLEWRYVTMKVMPDELDDAIKGLRAMHFSGINLTMPHKVAAMKYMDEIAPSAKIIGAINTVVIKDGKMYGHNTDGQGFVDSMRAQGIPLEGKKLVVLGAGGAARAICVECALAGAAHITVINRDSSRGKDVAELVKSNTKCGADFIAWEGAVHIPACDVLINATSVGLEPAGEYPEICYADIKPGMVVQDIIPHTDVTPFMKKAEECGAKVFDGLGMLVHQGAIGFKLWTGEDASLEVMHKALSEG